MARNSKSSNATFVATILAAMLAATVPAGAHVLYVDTDSTASSPEGESWSDAFDNLQDALAAAHTDLNVHVIRIADGIYNPHGSDRTVSFELVDEVAIEGG